MIQNNKVIGLTGCSGSGKSLVASILASMGAYIIDADALNHENLLPTGRAYHDVVKAFGRGILDPEGAINRKTLGGIVFAIPEQMRRLEEITHGHVVRQVQEHIRKAIDDYKVVVVDAPLLIEAGLHNDVDEVWVVVADYESRLMRISSRDGLSREDAVKRLAAGTPTEVLEAYAHVIIKNNGDIESLNRQIADIRDVF